MPLVRNEPTSELRKLVAQLGGTWSGNTAMCLCPAHRDRTPSLSIRQGDRGMLVTCHAGCLATDVIRAIARIVRLADFRSAAIKPERPISGKPHLAIWNAAGPIEGTLAERYVRRTRYLTVQLADVRFHARCPRGKGALASFDPALLVAMRKAGEVAAIQRIFLDPATANYVEKRTLGQAIGAAWTNGAPAQTIGLCEGFETAAAYSSLTGTKAWSTMGAKRFHQVIIPATVTTLILLADNDDEGRRARDRAFECYQRSGLSVETDWPLRNMNDWAQLLKR